MKFACFACSTSNTSSNVPESAFRVKFVFGCKLCLLLGGDLCQIQQPKVDDECEVRWLIKNSFGTTYSTRVFHRRVCCWSSHHVLALPHGILWSADQNTVASCLVCHMKRVVMMVFLKYQYFWIIKYGWQITVGMPAWWTRIIWSFLRIQLVNARALDPLIVNL